jgi:hypothetical protein
MDFPCLAGEHSLLPDIDACFHDIARMQQMKSVSLDHHSWYENDKDCVRGMQLLLHAFENNKYISSLGNTLMDLELFH